MPPKKQRSSSSGAVSKTALEQASATLQKLPEKPKDTWSLREAVTLLHDSITAALDRGYSHEEVAGLLANKGVSITASSLKRYLAVVKREKEGTGKTKVRRTRKPRTSKSESTEFAPASLNGTAKTESPAPSEPATKRRKTPTAAKHSRTTTKAEDNATKTAAKTKSKPTSRAKATPRATSARPRKRGSVS